MRMEKKGREGRKEKGVEGEKKMRKWKNSKKEKS